MSTGMRDLRPMSIGEMLDRAFTISFQHLLPFMAIVAIVIVPELFVNYFLVKGPFSVFSDQLFTLPAPGTPPPDPTKVFAAYANGMPYFMTLFVFYLTLVPLSNAAIVSGVSRAYLGMPVRFADCYRDALPRWPSLVVLALLWMAAVAVAAMSMAILFAFIGAAIAVIGGTLGNAGAITAIVLIIALTVAVILVILELYLAAAFSFVGAVLERLPAGSAFASGFTRVFGGGRVWRSLGIAAAIVGIVIGFELVALLLGMLSLSATHSLALQLVVSGVVNAFVYPFLFAVVAVSYYDVRIRREGFDLQMLAAQLTPSPPAPDSAR
jgi:hypothetical protein